MVYVVCIAAYIVIAGALEVVWEPRWKEEEVGVLIYATIFWPIALLVLLGQAIGRKITRRGR